MGGSSNPRPRSEQLKTTQLDVTPAAELRANSAAFFKAAKTSLEQVPPRPPSEPHPRPRPMLAPLTSLRPPPPRNQPPQALHQPAAPLGETQQAELKALTRVCVANTVFIASLPPEPKPGASAKMGFSAHPHFPVFTLAAPKA